jgi:hypothetical protein
MIWLSFRLRYEMLSPPQETTVLLLVPGKPWEGAEHLHRVLTNWLRDREYFELTDVCGEACPFHRGMIQSFAVWAGPPLSNPA